MKNQQDLIKKIKDKPELRGIDDSVIKDSLEKNLKVYNITLENLSSADARVLIKIIRSDLRTLAGRFRKSIKSRAGLLDSSNINELLMTHTSTSERMEFYPKLNDLLRELKIKSILDLGCGLNPIALAKSEIKYYASDINKEELSLIEIFFKKNKISGKVFICDLRKDDSFSLPKADICLLFKVLDIIEKKSHKLAENIILKSPCKYLLISFATKKLSGKPMNFPERRWLELLINRLGYSYKTFSSNNEIFYLVDKKRFTL